MDNPVPGAGEREAFEAWAFSNGFDISFSDGLYWDHETEIAWLSWQAALAAAAPAPAGEPPAAPEAGDEMRGRDVPTQESDGRLWSSGRPR